MDALIDFDMKMLLLELELLSLFDAVLMPSRLYITSDRGMGQKFNPAMNLYYQV